MSSPMPSARSTKSHKGDVKNVKISEPAGSSVEPMDTLEGKVSPDLPPSRNAMPGAVAAMLRQKCETTARSRLFMRLHGMRRASQSLSDETPLATGAHMDRRGSRPVSMQSSLAGDDDRVSASSRSRSLPRRPDSKRNELPWKRRHSQLAALKNADWSHFYLSTAATEDTFGAFLTLKTDPKVDAEYFMCFMPRAVADQCPLYKELLAVYNALHYWCQSQTLSVRRPLFAHKRLLIAVYHSEAAHLLTKVRISDGVVAPAPLKLLIEIATLCGKHHIEYRVADSDPDVLPSETITYSVIRLNEPEHRRRFAALLDFQTRIKGSKFHANEQIFPPVYVL